MKSQAETDMCNGLDAAWGDKIGTLICTPVHNREWILRWISRSMQTVPGFDVSIVSSSEVDPIELGGMIEGSRVEGSKVMYGDSGDIRTFGSEDPKMVIVDDDTTDEMFKTTVVPLMKNADRKFAAVISVQKAKEYEWAQELKRYT